MKFSSNARASDADILINLKQDDFTDRNRETLVRKLFNFCLAAVVVFMGVSFLVYNNALLGAMICATAGAFTFVLGKHIEKQKAIIKTTEFMNALFSSIIASGYDFTMICNLKGEVAYTNRGVKELFPEYVKPATRNVDMLLSMLKLSDENRTRINTSIANSKQDETTLTITNPEGLTSNIKLTVEAIARPAGFMLLRGRAI